MSGRYPRPMQLFQPLDFSSVPVSSYSDLANLVDTTGIPQSDPVNHHIASSVENNNLNAKRSVTGEYTTNRTAPDFFLPSVSAFNDSSGTQGRVGNFPQHFQHFSNQVLFHENSYHSGSSKIPSIAKPWFSGTQRMDVVDPINEAPVCTENTTNSCKTKKEKKQKAKIKRVRYIKPGCSDLCRRRCKQKISQSMREDLFNRYWNLEDETKKKEFIAQNAIKMPMMKCKEGSRRSFSVDWAFTVRGESFSVCKLFFLHTLDIPENTAYAAIKDSSFFNTDIPVIKGKAQEKSKPKPAWFETDLDDYSVLEKKGKHSRGTRYETFTKRDKFTEMRPGCKMCRRNCHSKFSYEERLAIFNDYRGLSNIRKQRDYISKYIHRMERKRIRAGESTRRNCSIQWNLPLNGKEIPVCKTFFLHTIGISERSAYNIGVQNEIIPVERKVKRPRKNLPAYLLSGKVKSFSTIIAKGKLRSALKISRKPKRKVESEASDSDEDLDEDHYLDSWQQSKWKNGKQRGRKRKKAFDKTVKFKRAKLDKLSSEEETTEENARETRKKARSAIKVSSTLFKLPIKKRGNMKHSVPVLKIKKGKVVSVSRKKRNPYKRKEMPTRNTYDLCPENCKKYCRKHLSEEARREIFKEFWGLKNMEEQRKFIAKCVKRIAKPTCACLVASHLRGKRRGYKISWNLMFRGLEIPVCKMFFMHVLQISDSVVYKAVREDDNFVSDVTMQPCKHFTGQNPVLKSSSDDKKEASKTSEHKNCLSEDADSENEVNKKENSILRQTGGENYDTSQASDLNLTKRVEDSIEIGNDKERCQPLLASTADANIMTNKNPSLCNNENLQKTHSSLQYISQNGICNIEANYETLIPCLNSEHLQELDQSLPIHFSNSHLTPYGPSEKVRNIFGNAHGSLSSLPNNSHSELWPKPTDSYHTMFGNNHSVFSPLADSRMEHVHNMAHPRDLSSHFPFPQNNSHHAHFPVQPSPGHHPGAFPQFHPNLPAPHMTHTGPMGFNNDVMGNFYHSSRFHNFGPPANIPSECVTTANSDYSMENDHQAYQESLLMHTLRNTNNDLFSPNQDKIKAKKKRKKTNSSPKPKQPKLKEPGVKKKREKKPFTKQLKAGCLESCKRKCSQKISQEAREKIFNDFWSLESDTKRREYVLPIVHKVPKKTCSGVSSRRCCTIEWTIPHGSKSHVVCKRFFLDTFDVGEKFVKTIFDKLEKKGGSMEDLRGRHCKRSNVFVREQEEIEKHIRSVSTLKAFQCISCQKDFTRWCLELGVVVSQLYKMYADQRKLEGKKPACRTSYTDVCTKKFNLKNSLPQEDLCDLCTVTTDAPQASMSGLATM